MFVSSFQNIDLFTAILQHSTVKVVNIDEKQTLNILHGKWYHYFSNHAHMTLINQKNRQLNRGIIRVHTEQRK